MDHTDHINLMRDGVPTPGGTWAEIDPGADALALAQLIGPSSTIHSVDHDVRALRA